MIVHHINDLAEITKMYAITLGVIIALEISLKKRIHGIYCSSSDCESRVDYSDGQSLSVYPGL